MAIFNNKGGKDEQVLKLFNEPAWNNPAVRIIDTKQKELAPRLYGYYSDRALIRTMITALKENHSTIPGYLEVVSNETAASKRDTLYFAMACFWSGEARLGQMDGVVATRPGFLEGREVVEVTYDPTELRLEELITTALAHHYADHVFCLSKNQFQVAQKTSPQQASLTRSKNAPRS